jgi:hypothetical protein
MEPDVPGLLFGHHSAFLFDVAERCIGPKVENNDSPIGILNLPLEERLRRDREALRKLLSEG